MLLLQGQEQWRKHPEQNLGISYIQTLVQKAFTLFKIRRSGLPKYLFNLIPQKNHFHNTRSVTSIPRTVAELIYSSTFLFQWNKLGLKIHNTKTLLPFRNSLLKVGRPSVKKIFLIFATQWVWSLLLAYD